MGTSPVRLRGVGGGVGGEIDTLHAVGLKRSIWRDGAFGMVPPLIWISFFSWFFLCFVFPLCSMESLIRAHKQLFIQRAPAPDQAQQFCGIVSQGGPPLAPNNAHS